MLAITMEWFRRDDWNRRSLASAPRAAEAGLVERLEWSAMQYDGDEANEDACRAAALFREAATALRAQAAAADAPPDLGQRSPMTDGPTPLSVRASVAEPKDAPSKNIWHPPFQRALTVFMLPDGGRASAEADIAAVGRGDNTILKISPGENYFTALRLAAEKDHTLYDKIVVWAKDDDGRFREVGLRFDDELRWPPGFCQEGWEMEVEILKLRRLARHDAPPDPEQQNEVKPT